MRPAAGLVTETLAPGAALEIAGQRPYGLAPEGTRGFRPALEYLRDAAALRRRLDEGRAELGVSRSDIPATFVAQLHAWALSAPPAAALLATGRVPVLPPASVAIAPARGTRAPAFGLLDTTIAVLPGDAAAGAPGTLTVADLDALVGVLWAAVEAHLELLVPALSMATGRPERALWRVGHDAVAMAITGLGESGTPAHRLGAVGGGEPARAAAARRRRPAGARRRRGKPGDGARTGGVLPGLPLPGLPAAVRRLPAHPHGRAPRPSRRRTCPASSTVG